MERHILVIVTCNRLSLLRECLEAAAAQTRVYDRIVVVDNHSTDGTAAYLQELKDNPRYTVFLEEVNLGGAGGFETGLKQAVAMDADWITLIDDDCILRKDYLEEICKAIDETDGRYAAYAGVPLTGGIRIGHRRRITGTLVKKEVGVPAAEYEKTSFICDLASFCGLVVSAAAVKKTGYPRGDFFIWYDDTEYCLRLSALTPILNWNRAVIDHKAAVGPPSDEAGWKDYYGIRNRILVTRLHYNRPTLVVVVVKKAAKALVTSARLILRGKAGAVPRQLSLYYDGIKDGLAAHTGFSGKYAPGRIGGKPS